MASEVNSQLIFNEIIVKIYIFMNKKYFKLFLTVSYTEFQRRLHFGHKQDNGIQLMAIVLKFE
jgi:hypothetical protein